MQYPRGYASLVGEPNPAIILVGNRQHGRFVAEFSRYSRDYDVRWAASTECGSSSSCPPGRPRRPAPGRPFAIASSIVGGGGQGGLEYVDVENLADGTAQRLAVDGLFLLLGADPHCEWLPGGIARDDHGFVLTGRDIPKDAWVGGVPPDPLETSMPGIFVAGDVRAGSMKRVAAAAGEGASVVPMVHRWLDEHPVTPAAAPAPEVRPE